MGFTGEENHDITLNDAADMTSRFRETIATGDKIGGYFGSVAIRRILDQDGCVGIRYYYGYNGNNEPVLVLVGVDADENDLVNGELAEMSYPCPNWCSTPNQLNGGS